MAKLDLSHFTLSDPCVALKGSDLKRIRYSDLNYTSRMKALLEATRDAGKPLTAEPFNDLLNGRRSLQYVIEFVEKL